MNNYATWEGAKFYIARVKNGKVHIEPLEKGRDFAMKESQKHPIGLIAEHMYDTKGRGGTHIKHVAVYYKGTNAEVLPPRDLDHPHIGVLESYLANMDEDEDMVIGMTYERPDADHDSFRKKRMGKAKPKRKVVKKVVKKCKCK